MKVWHDSSVGNDTTTMPRINVLLSHSEEARFAAYCSERGFKKSTLIARLVREHLDQEGFGAQTSLALNVHSGNARRTTSTTQQRKKVRKAIVHG